MASKRKSIGRTLRGPELRAFKHSVSILKTKGLVRKTTDARKQKPTRYMRAKVKSLQPVLEGKLAGVRRSAKVASEYRQAGFQVFNNRVLVEPGLARKVRAAKSRPGEYMITRQLAGGKTPDTATVIERVILPATVRNFDAFLDRARAGEFDKLKRPQDLWAFQFYGNNSSASFQTMDQLLEWLDHYEAIQGDYDGAWEHFFLFRVYPPGAWDTSAGPRQLYYKNLRGRRRKVNATGRNAGGRRPGLMTMDEIRAYDAKRKREAREKESPSDKAARLKYNRENMRKVRAAKYKAAGAKPHGNRGKYRR